MAEYAGYRSTLEIELATVWTAVAQIKDLSGPEAEADQIEVSHRDSRSRRYVAGMIDGGEVTFDIVFDPDHASHNPSTTGSMYNLLETGDVNSFRITFPGVAGATSDAETTATFDAFVSAFTIDSPMEDAISASITLKITGAIVWAHVAAI